LFDPGAPQISLKKEPESVWKDLDLTQLRRLHFTGGEPLLNKDNKKILQHLDKLGVLSNVVLSCSE
jgi:organic radical activating enzyme